MNPQSCHFDSKRTSGSMSGIVVAAIGFQLLLCSVTAAASSTIDRIPSSVAHALRDIIVDRHAAASRQFHIAESDGVFDDCLITDSSTSAQIERILMADQDLGYWLVNLPPPAA